MELDQIAQRVGVAVNNLNQALADAENAGVKFDVKYVSAGSMYSFRSYPNTTLIVTLLKEL